MNLELKDFWWSAKPSGVAAQLDGGAVKAAWIYDHGACSREEHLKQYLLDAGFDAWDAFVKETADISHHRYREYTYLATFQRDRDDTLESSEGGFMVNLWWSLDVMDPFGFLDISAGYYYYIVLDDGLLALDPHKIHLEVDGDIFDLAEDAAFDELHNGVPDKFREMVTSKQFVDLLPGSSVGDCIVNAPDACSLAAQLVAGSRAAPKPWVTHRMKPH